VGSLASSEETERETRKDGALTISGLEFCVIEPPDLSYPFASGDGLTIGSGSGNPENVSFLTGHSTRYVRTLVLR
jgi:hypothetical protein